MTLKLEKCLAVTAKSPIDFMAQGNACMRIGHIWFGWDPASNAPDRYCTVTGIFTFSNKQIAQVFPLRGESSLTFANEMPPADTISVEVMVHSSRFRSCIQELNAALLVSRVLPVMNPIIAMFSRAALLPEEFPDETEYAGKPDEYQRVAMARYAAFPVMMDIGMLQIMTIGKPSELRVMIPLRPVITATSRKERQRYLVTMDDAIQQHTVLKQMEDSRGSGSKLDAIASLVGVRATNLKKMLDRVSARRNGTLITSAVKPGDVIGGVFAWQVDGLFFGTRPSSRPGYVKTVGGTILKDEVKEFSLGELVTEKMERITRTVVAAEPTLTKAHAIVLHGIPDSAAAAKLAEMIRSRNDDAKDLITFYGGGSLVLGRKGSLVRLIDVPGIDGRIPVVGVDRKDKTNFGIYVSGADFTGMELEKIIESVVSLAGTVTKVVPSGDPRPGIALAIHAPLDRSDWSRIVTDQRLSGWIDSSTFMMGVKGNMYENGWALTDRILMPRYMFDGYTDPTPMSCFSMQSGVCSGISGCVDVSTGAPMGFVGSRREDAAGCSRFLPVYAMTKDRGETTTDTGLIDNWLQG